MTDRSPKKQIGPATCRPDLFALASLDANAARLLLLPALRGLLATLGGLLCAALCGLLTSCHGASLKIGCARHRRTRDTRGDVPGTECGVASAYTRSKFSRIAQYPPRNGTVGGTSASVGRLRSRTRFARPVQHRHGMRAGTTTTQCHSHRAAVHANANHRQCHVKCRFARNVRARCARAARVPRAPPTPWCSSAECTSGAPPCDLGTPEFR
jgi:hypothetical protein